MREMMSESPEVRAVPDWRHKILLPDGSTTPGTQDNPGQLAVMQLPVDLTGKTVLDIGCSDGFLAFECERRGASLVVGLDNFGSPYVNAPTGFAVVKRLLQSKVELVLDDFTTMDLSKLGTFDLVLFLGVLYHLRSPLTGLERVACVCREHAIVETAVTRPYVGWKWALVRRFFPGALPDRYMTFGGPEVNKDPTTWWAQSPECVEAMMRACGFCDVRTVHSDWARGIFHGFGPARGTDVNAFTVSYDRVTIKQAVLGVTGADSDDLASLSIAQFGAVKQAAAEIKAKELFRGGQHSN